MIENIELRLSPEEAASDLRITAAASTALAIDANRITRAVVTRRSIDARQRNIVVNLSVRVYIDQPAPDSLATPVDYTELPTDAPTAIVVGAGPAGLFAALRLIERGVRPIVVERGRDVDTRRKDVAALSRTGVVDPDSNYCFGEGGAGTFSDGKLYTRSKKRGSVDKMLNIFVQHGADESILVDVHPHIGTDRLPGIIKSMRQTIERCGGEVLFATRMTRLIVNNETNRVEGIVTASGQELHGPVILATGHSARDVYRSLNDSGVLLEPKGIAVGVRLEHPQQLVDKIRYHKPGGRGRFLPPAEYTMLARVDDRAVYSFCMCPGGIVVPASSAPGELVVNGMSPSNRGSQWANSGMVVEILPEDVTDGDTPGNPLKMMAYQEAIERRFYDDANHTLNAAAQRMEDFVAQKQSSTLPRSSYAPGIHSSRVDRLLPDEVSRRLRQGFKVFGQKNRGFLTNEAILIGAETRTSSPVRIPRDAETLRHVGFEGLYPAGEGAGYAGGIISAAIDGERCADALADTLFTTGKQTL